MEGKFLEPLVNRYSDLRFYGALLFWSDQSRKGVEGKFPVKLFVDKDMLLQQALEVKVTPLKILLENGVVKKVWVGTSTTSGARDAFCRDLEEATKSAATSNR